MTRSTNCSGGVVRESWEASDPVRVVHLLEHTTGWDDMHLREYAKDWPGSMDCVRDSTTTITPVFRLAPRYTHGVLQLRLRCRLHRGKDNGQKFEDFVAQNLFRPMGMNTATYFRPPAAEATTLYHNDGKAPYQYWNIRCAQRIDQCFRKRYAPMFSSSQSRRRQRKADSPAADIDRMESLRVPGRRKTD